MTKGPRPIDGTKPPAKLRRKKALIADCAKQLPGAVQSQYTSTCSSCNRQIKPGQTIFRDARSRMIVCTPCYLTTSEQERRQLPPSR